jgi:predicted ATPase
LQIPSSTLVRLTVGEKTGYYTSPLDPGLLAQPFKMHTSWVVLTGTSCTGKTTMIDQLVTRGFRTVPEVARSYFDAEMAGGRTIEEIRSDLATVERTVMHLQIRLEETLPTSEVIFLDRGLPDIITFFRYDGLNPAEVIPSCFLHRYAVVYVLDPFPIERDGLRIEDEEMRIFLDTWIPRDYEAVGYEVIRIPVLPREARLAYLLEDARQRGVITTGIIE